MYFDQQSKSFWKNKKVLITGHTGFKGSWLSVILLRLGAKVSGFSLPLDNNVNTLFSSLKIEKEINNYFGDISDLRTLENCLFNEKPDFIFHLAAQSLVRESYLEPIKTWNVNTMGTINLIEATKNKLNQCSLVMITTDKVYENNEWIYGYREIDPLGGFDPYSSSKAAAELAINTWRLCFSNSDENNIKISSARAGNVIGGGDWAKDRIIPDAMRALSMNKAIKVRNKNSTRPWQHVLEPLFGYLSLAKKMYESDQNSKYNSPFNFGPHTSSNKKVKELVDEILKTWNGDWVETEKSDTNMHEANKLNLVIDKAINLLDWEPKWCFEKTVEKTVSWYKSYYNDKENALNYCIKDVEDFLEV